MVIDMHYHFFDAPFHSPKMWNEMAQLCVEFSPAHKPVTFEEARRNLVPQMFDSTGEKTVRNLDNWGIEKAAILAVDNGFMYGEGEIGIEGQNEAIAMAARRFPDRLVAFLSIDPRRPNALELLDRCVNDWGMKGVKCHPDTGWFPDDEAYYPFWEKVSDYGLPVLTHTGPLPPPSKSECVHPERLDKLLADFPEMNVIAAHMAFRWYKELMEVGKRRPNLMCDCSAWQPTAHESYGKAAYILRKVMNVFGPNRMVFGTDAPTFSFLYSEREWVNMIRDLPTKAPEGIKFVPAEAEAVLYGNAARVLRLA
jgi:hypothetical protein